MIYSNTEPIDLLLRPFSILINRRRVKLSPIVLLSSQGETMSHGKGVREILFSNDLLGIWTKR